MMADKDKALREHLIYLLGGGGAHVDFESAVKDVPPELRGKIPPNAMHSLWGILEHLRIAQWDILDFSRNAKYEALKWPDEYWPKTEAPPDDRAWNQSIKRFRADLEAMKKLVSDPKTDLYAKIPHGEDQTILREALLIADHNAYHLGEFVIVRRLLGNWKS
jgi:hypothetical protein